MTESSLIFHGTTILAVHRNGKTVIGGDGQVTLGSTIIKGNAQKVKSLYDGKILVGFAGATADAFTLFEKLESKLKEFKGNLKKSAVELAKDWRSDKLLRRLEAMMIAADKDSIYIISGNGDILEPEEPMTAIGSGGSFAISAAKALYGNTDLSARDIVEKSLGIAAEICIYTNTNKTILELGQD